MELKIDFSGIEDLNSMHELLMEKFGFPNFYGKNVNALIDCLTSLRYPEDGMTKVSLERDEVLQLTVKSFPFSKDMITNHFLIAVQSVNQRYLMKGMSVPISLLFV